MQRQIDAGGDPGAGPVTPVFNKKTVFFDDRSSFCRIQAGSHLLVSGDFPPFSNPALAASSEPEQIHTSGA
ncbi:hypothetical protein [Erwinia amylovora]|uniref:hypothetical protein n=1 Tax=Erwinia amylovora TaxID=552 RepID=UPI00039BA7E8|nr:hypothetical protein [Erwinia amylovora]